MVEELIFVLELFFSYSYFASCNSCFDAFFFFGVWVHSNQLCIPTRLTGTPIAVSHNSFPARVYVLRCTQILMPLVSYSTLDD